MERSKRKIKYNKYPTEGNHITINKETFVQIFSVNKKKHYYNDLDINAFNDNKKLWQRIKPLFSDKQKS